jgi:hypothetical protein
MQVTQMVRLRNIELAVQIRDHLLSRIPNWSSMDIGESRTVEIPIEIREFSAAIWSTVTVDAIETLTPLHLAGMPITAKAKLSHTLDIWSGKKVFSLRWDQESTELITFQRGPWIQELLETMERVVN